MLAPADLPLPTTCTLGLACRCPFCVDEPAAYDLATPEDPRAVAALLQSFDAPVAPRPDVFLLLETFSQR